MYSKSLWKDLLIALLVSTIGHQAMWVLRIPPIFSLCLFTMVFMPIGYWFLINVIWFMLGGE